MFSIQIPTDSTQNVEVLTKYLNDHIESIEKGFNIDMSHLLTGAVSETPEVTSIEFVSTHEVKVFYTFKWSIHNLCLNIIDDNKEKGSLVATLNGQTMSFNEVLNTASRSTADEL